MGRKGGKVFGALLSGEGKTRWFKKGKYRDSRDHSL